MKVSLQWLREFVPLEKSVAEIADLLTFAGVEVEGIVTSGVAIDQVVVAQIQASEQHPNADRLSVCRVDDGAGLPRQIVCGAKNYQVGDKVPLALPGAVLPGDFKIKVGKLRGELSEGMLCSAKELGISEESAGLLILPPEAIPGTPIGELFPADTIFDLEITPNRPDLLSHRGIARELAAIIGIPLSLPVSQDLAPALNLVYLKNNDHSRSRSPEDASLALENLLQLALDVAGRSAGADAAQRFCAESESLLAWASENGWLLDPGAETYSLNDWEALEGGREHLVWRDAASGRVVKITRPPNFGARGNLTSYLQNIVASNALFGDDLRFEGVIRLAEGLAIVISQPFIQGDSATEQEIADWMQERGFLPAGENAFRHANGTLLADARPANILKAGSELFPIDLHILGGSTAPIAAPVLPVHLENAAACPWYSARVVRGVKVGPSPDWLRKKLEAVGLRPINNVVDVTNFVMLELGEPLHAFDLAKVDRGIVVRSASAGEKFLALDGREYTLTPDDLLIADETRALAIAGVMGGEESGVSAATTDVVLESALFSSTGIRRTSRRLGLSSDASYRFERGVDPGVLLTASARACQLLEEIAGGVADAVISIGGELPPLSWEVTLRNDRCRKLLGTPLPDSRIGAILTGLGLESLSESRWRIPSFRGDLTREVDLIEEIARVHGIGNIPARTQGFAAPISTADRLYDFQLRLKQRLVTRGFFEARTLSLRPENHPVENARRTDAALRVRNPLTEDQVFFRESLIPGLLTVADTNQRMGAASLRLLETGRIFRSGANEETLSLGLLLTGNSGQPDWRNPLRALDFFDLQETVTSLTSAPLDFRKTAHPTLLLAVEVFAGKQKLGWLGQIAPEIVRHTGLKQAVFAAELDLAALQSLTGTTPVFQPLDRFPAVTRDVALLAPEALSHAEIHAALLSAREPLLREVGLFDIFADPTGEKVPLGHKSLAYSLTYRSAERTLTQDEVNAAHARLKTRLVEQCGASLRE